MKILKYVLLIILLLISALASVYLYRELVKTELATEEETVTDEDVVLKANVYFSNVLQGVSAGEAFSVDLIVDTDLYELPAADFVLEYDSDVLEIISIDSGDFADFVRNEVSEDSDKVYISVLSDPNNVFSGVGNVAKLNLRALKSGYTRISFYEGEDKLATYLSAIGGARIPSEFEDLELTVK